MIFPLLLSLVMLPILGAILIVILPKTFASNMSRIITGIVLVAVAVIVYWSTAYGLPSLSASYTYIPQLNVDFGLVVNQVTLILVAMTAVIFFAASFVGDYFIGKDNKLYTSLFVIMEASTIGVFISSNFFLFFLFWEISEVAMFFIIFLYGGIDRRYAAVKFIVYSIFSSMLILIGIMLLYFYSAPHTFTIASLEGGIVNMPQNIQILTFLLLLVGFMVKVPVFPLHSWLPDAHTEAPATGSMILAGVLLKFGGYGLILTFAIMHSIALTYAPYLAILFAFSAIYGALVAIRKKNLKKMIAFTSIADMGIIAFALIALNQFGTIGATYSMLAHGLAISMLFMLAGMFDKEYGTLDISGITGVAKWSSVAAFFFMFGIFAVIGIPLTTGFIGDVLLFIGSTTTFGIFGVVPALAIIIVGAYMFWVAERSIFSQQGSREQASSYMNRTVIAAAAVLAAFTILFGLIPLLLNT